MTRRLLAPLAAVLVLAAVAVSIGRAAHTAHQPPVNVEHAIRLAAVTYHVDYETLRRKAWCESRYNPRARNRSSSASGLFQFLRSTWRTTPYARFDVMDPYANALAAGWMHRVGRGGEWACR